MFLGFKKDKKSSGNAKGISNKDGGMVGAGTPGRTVTVNVDGKTKEVKLLDNPLTLPKKREHKAMDYDYEVSENDDYDI